MTEVCHANYVIFLLYFMSLFVIFSPYLCHTSMPRLQRDKVGGAFIPPGGDPYHIALYVPSIKGAHAYVQFYQYGSFEKTGELCS